MKFIRSLMSLIAIAQLSMAYLKHCRSFPLILGRWFARCWLNTKNLLCLGVIASSVALGACGQKGPLTLPDATTPHNPKTTSTTRTP